MSFQFKTLTPYHLARFSEQAYAEVPKPFFKKWELLSISVLNDYGYHGVAYINLSEQRVIIAHRGSDFNLLNNVISDSKIAISHLPESQKAASAFSTEVRSSVPSEYEIIETGHSLGAFHAEMNVALLGNAHAITFESPGIGEMCVALELSPGRTRFISYFSNPNVVNTAKPHIGRLYRICTYHVDKEGYKFSQGGYLQDLTKALIESPTSMNSPYDIGITLMKTTGSKFVNLQALQHSLSALINAMHPQIGYPWLMREVSHWPSLSEFLKGQTLASLESSTQFRGNVSSSSSSSSSSDLSVVPYIPLVAQNIRIEAALNQMQGYEAGNFVVPEDLDQKRLFVNVYQQGALGRFDVFYKDAELRATFEQALGSSNVENVVLPTLAPDDAQPSNQESPVVKPAPQPASLAVKLANSLVGNNRLIEEGKWLVSLVKSLGDREHAFLLLDGIRDGVSIHIRSDFFLDLDARKEVVAKLPMGIASGVNALWGSSENLVGRGFVRTGEIQASEYEKLLGNCIHQSWPINQRQADQLVERFAKEARKPYTYAIVGNHPSSVVSGSSIAQPHNCVTWCQDILSEEFGFEKQGKWLPVKWPGTIVKETIRAETSTNSISTSSSLLSSSSSMFGTSNSQISSLKQNMSSSKGSIADRVNSKAASSGNSKRPLS